MDICTKLIYECSDARISRMTDLSDGKCQTPDEDNCRNTTISDARRPDFNGVAIAGHSR